MADPAGVRLPIEFEFLAPSEEADFMTYIRGNKKEEIKTTAGMAERGGQEETELILHTLLTDSSQVHFISKFIK